MAKKREIQLSEFDKVVIDSFKNDKGIYVNVRKFYCTRNDDTWKPGRQGFTIKVEHQDELLKKLRFAFEKAEDEAKELDSDSDKKGKGKKDDSKSSKDSKSKKKVSKKSRSDD